MLNINEIKLIESNYVNIRNIENPDKELQLIALRQNINALRLMKNPHEEVQLEAIKMDYHSIRYIDNPTESVKALCREMLLNDNQFHN